MQNPVGMQVVEGSHMAAGCQVPGLNARQEVPSHLVLLVVDCRRIFTKCQIKRISYSEQATVCTSLLLNN